jgi:hypothetical protein
MIRTFLVLLFSLAPAALGCSVPVFRYALEAWTPAAYEMFVFHRGKLSAADSKLLDALRKNADDEKTPVNITFTAVDVSEKMDERAQKLWGEQKDAALPRAVLAYPDSSDSFWSGTLNAELLTQIAPSPARADIAKRVAGGDSVVFVLLESGKKDADSAAEALLSKELAGLQATMKLPKQDDEEDEFTPRRRRLDIPLKLKFSILKLARSDAKEKVFVDMLMKTDAKLSAAQPIIFPVFGRGRLLCALTGTTISTASLTECTTFLSGACSCQVKELNPGVDLLMNVNWDTLLDEAVKQAAKNPEKKDPSEIRPASENLSTPGKKPAAEVIVTSPTQLPPSHGVENSKETDKLLWVAIAAVAALVVFVGARALKTGSS